MPGVKGVYLHVMIGVGPAIVCFVFETGWGQFYVHACAYNF